MASYPSSIISFSPVVDNVTDVNAAWGNPVQDEIQAIETELGTTPKSGAATLAARLSHVLATTGQLQFVDSESLTISSGAITVTGNRAFLNTEGGAATDNLDTITAMADGWFLIVRPLYDARDVTIRNNGGGTGNIICIGSADITLASTADFAVLIYDSSLAKWLAMGVSACGLVNGANTWTGAQTFNAGVLMPFYSFTTSQTLGSNRYLAVFDTTSGNLDCTLPDAATYAGWSFRVHKSVAANTLTLKCTGSDTINGSATRSLTAAHEDVIVFSIGSGGWII